MKRSLEIALRYGVAMAAVGAALGTKLLLDPLTVQDTPFLLVFGAIIVSSWYGGLGPGLLATAVSALATDYFFLYPRGILTGFSLEGIDVITFILEGVLVSLLTSSLRSARDRAQRSTLEAKSHEESLRESEERFRLMVEGVKDYAMFMLDPGGHVTTWNDGAEQVEGYGEGEILGRHFSSFYQEEDVERGHPEDVLRAALAEGRYVEEGLKIRKDGSRFWASAVITTLRDRKGNLKGFSMVVHDATERKQTTCCASWPIAARRSLLRSITGPHSSMWPASRCPPWPTGAPSTSWRRTALSRGSLWSILTPRRAR
jgi:PAS domain S-box-containing protein